ncbi:MAG: hypothetical protein HG424_002990 [candidate division SR1 bacterium]|nr:hypothetical protein [candidate division SR1 bacterium]
MEKLLKLINEYRLEKGASEYTEYIPETGYFTRKSYFYEHYSWVISKKFGFIQWLVDNDKIDKQWAKNLLYESEIFNPLPYTDLAERLIMYLSIQDDPIEFLISILK